MASNPGHIPAGGREKISVEVGTQNRGGSTLNKGFTVYTNDPAKPQVVLRIKGKVRGYLTVAPGYVRLMGSSDREISRTVEILPLEGHTFSIKDVKAQKGGEDFRFSFKPKSKEAPGQGYLLLVENTRKQAGNYHDTIVVKTDSKHKPSLRIPVYGRIHEPSPGSRQQPK